MWMMLGWLSWAASFASSMNMPTNSALSVRCGRIFLMATVFWKPSTPRIRAFHTSAMPPAAIFSSSVYWPKRSPAARRLGARSGWAASRPGARRRAWRHGSARRPGCGPRAARDPRRGAAPGGGRGGTARRSPGRRDDGVALAARSRQLLELPRGRARRWSGAARRCFRRVVAGGRGRRRGGRRPAGPRREPRRPVRRPRRAPGRRCGRAAGGGGAAAAASGAAGAGAEAGRSAAWRAAPERAARAAPAAHRPARGTRPTGAARTAGGAAGLGGAGRRRRRSRRGCRGVGPRPRPQLREGPAHQRLDAGGAGPRIGRVAAPGPGRPPGRGLRRGAGPSDTGERLLELALDLAVIAEPAPGRAAGTGDDGGAVRRPPAGGLRPTRRGRRHGRRRTALRPRPACRRRCRAR